MKDPAFLFYPNDYIGGTLGMSFEQKGAYIELLMTQFNRGHMTYHMIGQVLGQSFELWETLLDKFKTDTDGRFYNDRLEIEQNKRKHYSDSRKNNRLGLNQYSKTEEDICGHMTSHMENENNIYSIFYKKELEISKNDEKYKYFIDFIYGNNELKTELSGLLLIRDQLTFEQFTNLLEKAKTNSIKLMDTVLKIDNDKKYWKGKKSLYQTMNNWIENRFVK